MLTPTGTAIVTPDAGLMNPNHYLAVAIQYLYAHRPGWRPDAAVGKTLVSSSMIDRVTASSDGGSGRCRSGSSGSCPGLIDGSVGFGGEESAGASFLRAGRQRVDHRQGQHPARPARERDPRRDRQGPLSQLYAGLTAEFGDPAYQRVDAAATPEQKARLAKLSRFVHRRHVARR